MAIRLFSDLHLEFADYDIPFLVTDPEDVLLLAGDIGVTAKPHTFDRVREWAGGRFKNIIHVCGNHEFYGGSLIRSRAKIRDEIMVGITDHNIAVDEKVVRVDNTSFICATLWTDFNGANPVTMQIIRQALNDYKYIRTGNHAEPYQRRIRPHDILNEHALDKEFIFESIAAEKAAEQKTVVVTHHGPTCKSIAPQYKGDPVNWGYASDLEQRIMDHGPDLWVHGHTHWSFDYTVGNTRVVSNPRGYASRIQRGYGEPPTIVNENKKFDPFLRLEV